MANNFFGGKEDGHDHPEGEPKKNEKHEHEPNPLSSHQSQRQEISQFWNKFSMIQIVKTQSKKSGPSISNKPTKIPKGGNMLDGLKKEIASEEQAQ